MNYVQLPLEECTEGTLVEVMPRTAGTGPMDAQAAEIHNTARDKGFWPNKYYDYMTLKITEEAVCTKLALIHSEVTEVLEAVRKNQGKDAIVEEMADVYIRLLDLYAALRNSGQVDASFDNVVQLKMNKNALRPQLHGNNF